MKTKNRLERITLRQKALALAVAACLAPTTGYSNPSGASIVAGQAQIASQGNTLTVTNTPGTIINWQQFNIGQNETTRFIQQNAQSSVLNRVTGGNPSQILGTLQSNGQVWLVNPQGIFFGRNAVIDVPGLIASTLNIRNEDFLNRHLVFSGGNGSLVNEGRIVSPLGGSIYLIGKEVRNEGVIKSEGGKVLLAAGQEVQLIDTAGPELTVTLTAAGNKALNLGTIDAAGGSINLYGALIEQQGIVRADSAVVDAVGRIRLEASEAVSVSGTLSATNSAGQGGKVVVTAPQVTLKSGSLIDASGAAGGGTVAVGGGWQGQDAGIANATTTTMENGATIKADALNAGHGGTVSVWANHTTDFKGFISARGGEQGGDGGRVETSGKKFLGLGGLADTRAPKGETGFWLLDPEVVCVDDSGCTGTYNPLNFYVSPSQYTIVTTSMLDSMLQSSNVSVTATDYFAFLPNGGAYTVSSSVPSGRSVSVSAPFIYANGTFDAVTNSKVMSLSYSATGSSASFSANSGSIILDSGAKTWLYSPTTTYTCDVYGVCSSPSYPAASSVSLTASGGRIKAYHGSEVHIGNIRSSVTNSDGSKTYTVDNSQVTVNGNTDFYGSVKANTLSVSGYLDTDQPGIFGGRPSIEATTVSITDHDTGSFYLGTDNCPGTHDGCFNDVALDVDGTWHNLNLYLPNYAGLEVVGNFNSRATHTTNIYARSIWVNSAINISSGSLTLSTPYGSSSSPGELEINAAVTVQNRLTLNSGSAWTPLRIEAPVKAGSIYIDTDNVFELKNTLTATGYSLFTADPAKKHLPIQIRVFGNGTFDNQAGASAIQSTGGDWLITTLGSSSVYNAGGLVTTTKTPADLAAEGYYPRSSSTSNGAYLGYYPTYSSGAETIYVGKGTTTTSTPSVATDPCIANPSSCSSTTTSSAEKLTTSEKATESSSTTVSAPVSFSAELNVSASVAGSSATAATSSTSSTSAIRSDLSIAGGTGEIAGVSALLTISRTDEVKTVTEIRSEAQQARSEAKVLRQEAGKAEALAQRAEREAQQAEKTAREAKSPEARRVAQEIAKARRVEANQIKGVARSRAAEAEAHESAASGRDAVASAKETRATQLGSGAAAGDRSADGKTVVSAARAEATATEQKAQQAGATARQAEQQVKQAEAAVKSARTPEEKAAAQRTLETRRQESATRQKEAQTLQAEAGSKSRQADAAEARVHKAEARAAESEAKRAEAQSRHADGEARQAEGALKTARTPEERALAGRVVESRKVEAEARRAEAGALKAEAEARSARAEAAEARTPQARATAAQRAEQKAEVATARRQAAEVKLAESRVKQAEAEGQKAASEARAAKHPGERQLALHRVEEKGAEVVAHKAVAEARKAEGVAARVERQARQAETAAKAEKNTARRAELEKRAELRKAEAETRKAEAQARKAEAEGKRAEAVKKAEERRAAEEKRVAERKAEASKVFSAIAASALSRAQRNELLAARHELKTATLKPALDILIANPAAADLPPCGAAGGLCIPDAGAAQRAEAQKAVQQSTQLARQQTAQQVSSQLAAVSQQAAVQQSAAAAGRLFPAVNVSLTPVQISLPQIQRKVAVLYGINKYQDSKIPSLDSAAPDAKAVAKVLNENLGYEVKVIEDAGKADIVSSLNQLAQEVGPNDSVTVYYAGHGYLMPQNGNGYWIPADAKVSKPDNWISNNDIARLLGNIPAKQVMLVSDSCYSGSLTKEQKIAAQSVSNKPEEILGRRSVTIFSSGGEEPVSDEGKEGHSIFAWSLMNSLKEVNQFDKGSRVYESVRQSVSKDFEQTPQYGGAVSAGHTSGGDYLFEKRTYR